MAVLHLMVGLPCSGKTTEARRLEKEYHALRLTSDEWQIRLFGQDALDPSHDERHGAIEKIMWEVASRVLSLGMDVILDFGFWAREEREDFRRRAHALGAGFQIHYMEASEEELLRRLAVRNAEMPEGTFVIREAEMREYMALFQPPKADELLWN